VRRHVPDFLLARDGGPVVVDVKPRQHLGKEKTTFTLTWCKSVVEDRGWEYEVWSEPPEAELANLRMLAGYRRKWLFDPSLLDALADADLDGARFLSCGGARPPRWTRRFGRQVPQSHGLAVADAVFHDGLLVKPSAPVTATGRVRSCSGTSTTLPSPSPGSRTRSACGAR
jgi:hypothetical protein